MDRLSRLAYSKPFVLFLWFGLSLFVVLKGIITHQTFNNFTIFRYNFFNTIHQHNLYAAQPEHYDDLNHYGPAFSIVIAPFALLPESLGVVLWVFCNTLILYLAIKSLPLKKGVYLPILLICAHEMMTTAANVQSNALIAALIILSFNLIKKEKDFWAALMIALGTFIKLYGIVGLAFFFFSEHKIKLAAGLIFWALVFFVLPMAISSPDFIIKTYRDWYEDLIAKNDQNQGSFLQEICVMGLIRTVFHYNNLRNAYVIIPALGLFGLSFLRVKCLKELPYQLLILSSVLIFAVIFSSSAESSTYIIAFVGVAIWFMNLNRPVTRLESVLLVFAIIITSFSPSDLFPKAIRMNYIVPYKLKALPCLLIWLKIIHETLSRKFNTDQKSVRLMTAQ